MTEGPNGTLATPLKTRKGVTVGGMNIPVADANSPSLRATANPVVIQSLRDVDGEDELPLKSRRCMRGYLRFILLMSPVVLRECLLDWSDLRYPGEFFPIQRTAGERCDGDQNSTPHYLNENRL